MNGGAGSRFPRIYTKQMYGVQLQWFVQSSKATTNNRLTTNYGTRANDTGDGATSISGYSLYADDRGSK